MHEESPEKIYSSLSSVWPENNRWYDYTHKCITDFIQTSLLKQFNSQTLYLNAGSGGSTYDLPGICYHVDIAENLICKFPNYTVASIENMPFADSFFDASICVGSVVNYCDIVKSIHELTRTLKPGGILILEYERSNTGELWFTKEYGKGVTLQRYEYLGHIHTMWLYSERIINNLLADNSLSVLARKRFHNLSALVNRATGNEESSGRFACLDALLSPIAYFTAHNIIILCKKALS